MFFVFHLLRHLLPQWRSNLDKKDACYQTKYFLRGHLYINKTIRDGCNSKAYLVSFLVALRFYQRFTLSLSIYFHARTVLLPQETQFTSFFANVKKYALRRNNSLSNQLQRKPHNIVFPFQRPSAKGSHHLKKYRILRKTFSKW